MASGDSSFDIVSKVDIPELDNALNQARKEIDNRYDFKGAGSRIESTHETITAHSADEFHLNAIIEVIETRLTRRNVPIKAISWGAVQPGSKGTVKREAAILQGIDQDKAREITKFIKGVDKKINVTIQKDQVRVSSKSKDSLQNVIKAVKEHDFVLPLQFSNYR
ncbi:MAG: YajQ family cyclic di-GMP-binding protein [Candidatus Anoxymicrobium japonicum]|uniref:Nucleotide-binding protein CVT63_03710 n=1 Tax=Candidatus Anoxymicrobium japonicum TaxID=2013648 RepID=A0A2N3G696_9ACTN|nr:MAG: YajQ family cyclic di-GMP-binding protein [Candidatus Anoxymicrobium japonicum]